MTTSLFFQPHARIFSRKVCNFDGLSTLIFDDSMEVERKNVEPGNDISQHLAVKDPAKTRTLIVQCKQKSLNKFYVKSFARMHQDQQSGRYLEGSGRQ